MSKDHNHFALLRNVQHTLKTHRLWGTANNRWHPDDNIAPPAASSSIAES